MDLIVNRPVVIAFLGILYIFQGRNQVIWFVGQERWTKSTPYLVFKSRNNSVHMNILTLTLYYLHN